MDRILEVFKEDTKCEFEIDIENLVYDGIYTYESRSIHNENRSIYSLYTRYSFNTKDGLDFGYLLFEYDVSNTQDIIKDIDNTVFNKILISDYGLALAVRSNLYKDKNGYYQYARSVIKNKIFKVRFPEWAIYFIETIDNNIANDKSIPFPIRKNIVGCKFNTNELSLIRNIISINYKEEFKDDIRIHSIAIDNSKGLDIIKHYNIKDVPVYIDCTIPTSMYSSLDHSYYRSKGLRFVITLLLPSNSIRKIRKNIKPYLDTEKDFLDRKIAENMKPGSHNKPNIFIMSLPINHAYCKDGKVVDKVIAVLSGGRNTSKIDNSYVKYNLLSNFVSFTEYFINILGVPEVMEE